MLLPALTKAKTKAQGTKCLSNLKQLGLAWTLYNGDNEDGVPPNSGLGNTNTWIQGWLNVSQSPALNPDNTNTLYLIQSLLAPYQGKSLGVWRCPGDGSGLVRSCSMNCWLNADINVKCGCSQQSGPGLQDRSARFGHDGACSQPDICFR